MITLSTGLLKGISIRTPQVASTRPSSARLRQALFNTLAPIVNDWESMIVADIFAGSGALGFEAASHGAAQIFFIENNKIALNTLHQNITAITQHLTKQKHTPPQLIVLGASVEQSYGKLPVSHLILADPPYNQSHGEQLLTLEQTHQRLAPGGLLVLEEQRSKNLDAWTKNIETLASDASLDLLKLKEYGDSVVVFFKKRS